MVTSFKASALEGEPSITEHFSVLQLLTLRREENGNIVFHRRNNRKGSATAVLAELWDFERMLEQFAQLSLFEHKL
ncbi:hypothetical protein SKAU_G00073060 [Synaphobranchus kaupii]|uniref:Uncharacterized protein n=1 Tax=Synaphobranchus kaupii TaxID=118154 RepID=A0A9Q1JAP8_SYNKA|nr:hypothetical protein SKAU_G00073060 [Synaphobranchus kaupii]